jgi:hypothetical protein
MAKALSHHGRASENGCRKKALVIRKLPRILTLRRAKKPRHGILIYFNLQSRSRGTRVIHTVTGAKRGRSMRFRYFPRAFTSLRSLGNR